MEKNVRLRIYGKGLNVFDDVKDYIEKQSKEIINACDDGSEVSVLISKTRGIFKTEITAKYMKKPIRVEKTDDDVKSSISDACGTMEAKISKIHGKVIAKRKGAQGLGDMITESEVNEMEDLELVRNKFFKLQPMSPKEACLEMEMLGHTFFMFTNKATNRAAVVYKRNDGRYGLIEGE